MIERAIRLVVMACLATVACKRTIATPNPRAEVLPDGAMWVETLDLSQVTTGYGRALAGRNVTGNPMRMGGVAYRHGIGTHADSELHVELGGAVERFVAEVGLDDQLECLSDYDAPRLAGARFVVFADGRQVMDTGIVRHGEAPRRIDVQLGGVKRLRLVVQGDKGARFNHANWGGALFVLRKGHAGRPVAVPAPDGHLGRKSVAVTAIGDTAPAALSSEDNQRLLAGTWSSQAVLWLDALAKGQPGFVAHSPGEEKHGLRLGVDRHARGISVRGESALHVSLAGGAQRLLARVGIDGAFHCGKALSGSGARFVVWVDGNRAFDSGVLTATSDPVALAVELAGAQDLVLVTQMDDLVDVDLLWAGAVLVLDDARPAEPRVVAPPPVAPPEIAQFDPGELGIFGPLTVGTTPGRPFVYRIPASGPAPLSFSVRNLPAGLSLDRKTGVLHGAVQQTGIHELALSVASGGRKVERRLFIEAIPGRLARTPPLGFNSWNAFGTGVDADKIRATARAFVERGLAARGFRYVNIDDGWQGKRDGEGVLQPNAKFPDLKVLAGELHAQGLLLGIYSSPGPLSCAGYEGSYRWESQDARTWAGWGIDYLKYDWCSYGKLADESSLQDLQKPFRKMAQALAEVDRDLVYSISQHGRGQVWTWGRLVGAHAWRLTNDIVDTWGSVERIGFFDWGNTPFAGPGGWNDADMLVVGRLGWGDGLRPTRLSQHEQQTHITLWTLLASPLLIGADLSALDDFTRDLLTNPEVLAVHQDPLGQQGSRVEHDGGAEVWLRRLHDRTVAIGFFNRGPQARVVSVNLDVFGAGKTHPLRDLWLRKDVGTHVGVFRQEVPPHGARLFKLGAPQPNAWRPAPN